VISEAWLAGDKRKALPGPALFSSKHLSEPDEMTLKEPSFTMDNTKGEVATLGGGCFWCIEAPFQLLEGVSKVTSGYAGGHVPDPTYRQVTSGKTGHAEVVQIRFNPEVIAFREVLEVFFFLHDPTTPNRQGADVGPQYRSIILYHTPEQRKVAEEVIAELERNNVFGAPIVTELEPFTAFYPAEEYHQNYYRRNQGQTYCQFVVKPKVEKLRNTYQERLKKTRAVT
jgi:peptide-methionine (S)-S-oxide reductase